MFFRAFVCVAVWVGVRAEEPFQDSPLLSMMWQAVDQNDNNALDRVLDETPAAVRARASDGRGLAWWSFEFENTYALTALAAHGYDLLSTDEDLEGNVPSDMVDGAKKEKLVAAAKAGVDSYKKKQAERAEARKRAAETDDDDFDLDDEEDIADDEF
mmetsp:Transcript_18509/g.49648  ORF Transcript_18509/g.49648 Transcript_18509/m.49648 type:complete len:157 (-) Transcript_18509:71-541(-)